MNDQFLNNLFQTGLYFYSSLLQADAAILAFGTVFIVFKLQSLDSVKQGIIQAYHSKGSSQTANVNSLLLSTDPQRIANTLVGLKENAYDYQNYLYIVLIPARSSEISRSIKWPVKVIGLHTIISAILLVTNQFIYQWMFLEYILLSLTFIWFGYGIFLAASLAISLLTKSDDYQLEKLRPDIHSEMCKIEKKRLNNLRFILLKNCIVLNRKKK